MNKFDFISKFEDTCKKLKIKPKYIIEHSLKISNNSINIDRVGILIKKNSITEKNLTNFINEFFVDYQDVILFIDESKKKYGDKIHNVILGYSNQSIEIYIEYISPIDELPIIISYGLNNKQHSEYYLIKNSKDYVDEFINLIKEKITLSNTKNFYDGGWYKNGENDMTYLTIRKKSFKKTLRNLCYDINPKEKKTIDERFDKNKDKTINVIGYNTKNSVLTLNIYGVKLSLFFRLFLNIIRSINI